MFSCQLPRNRPVTSSELVAQDGADAVLQALLDVGAVDMDAQHSVSLTAVGKQSLRVLLPVSIARRFLRSVRALPVEERSKHELLCTLEQRGWTHVVVSDREQLRLVRRKAFLHPDVGWEPQEGAERGALEPGMEITREKIWYLRAGQKTLHQHYLVLLLTSETHKQPVPHLHKDSMWYRRVRGIPVRQREHHVRPDGYPDDAWGHEGVRPQRRRQRVVRRRQPQQDGHHGEDLVVAQPVLEGALAEPVLDDGAVSSDHGGDSASDGVAASSSSTSSSSTTSSSSDSSNSSTSSSSSSNNTHDGVDIAHPADPQAAGDRVAAAEDVHVPADRREAAPAPPEEHQQRELVRDPTAGFEWGLCRVTARPHAQGFQMTCRHPLHTVLGLAPCTKTYTDSRCTNDEKLHLLKAWARAGLTCGSKEEHKIAWRTVLDDYQAGRLPITTPIEPITVWPA